MYVCMYVVVCIYVIIAAHDENYHALTTGSVWHAIVMSCAGSYDERVSMSTKEYLCPMTKEYLCLRKSIYVL